MKNYEINLLSKGLNVDKNLTYTAKIWREKGELETNIELIKATFEDKNLTILYLKKLLLDLKMTEYIYQYAIQTAKEEQFFEEKKDYEAREIYNNILVKYVEEQLRAIQ